MSSHLTTVITEKQYREFARGLSEEIGTLPTIGSLKKDSVLREIDILAKQFFSQAIRQIKSHVDSNDGGIAVADIPLSDDLSSAENFVCGAATFTALFNAVGTPFRRNGEGAPFSLHKASHSSVGKMKSAGLEKFTPDAKLGFHNDATITTDGVALPRHIGVYNAFIGYNNPGCFHWLPTSSWNEADMFHQMAEEDVRTTVKLTPMMYEDANGDFVQRGPSFVHAPLIWKNTDGNFRYFLNGEVNSAENSDRLVEMCAAMRKSIASSDSRIRIDQRERRAIILRNTSGFHARDIFEDPIQGLDLSRIMLRIVDSRSEFYPGTLA
ncbi:hypothetical protein [Paraburkholderia sp. BCC1876]|uniref:hypothetical protein n=1 Tax=Paraburkholderia sp. BCC1876 TaxID=2676303 RepID=UPI0015926E89|nr:hypothetical protein [Paraburkholderia sp. BCC1876]